MSPFGQPITIITCNKKKVTVGHTSLKISEQKTLNLCCTATIGNCNQCLQTSVDLWHLKICIVYLHAAAPQDFSKLAASPLCKQECAMQALNMWHEGNGKAFFCFEE